MDSSSERTRLLLASRYPGLRGLVENLLQQQDWLEIVARTSNLERTATVSGRKHPDVVVLDGLCAETHSPALLERLDEALPECVVLITLTCDQPWELKSFTEQLGRTWRQVGLCEEPTAIVDAIQAVLRGEPRTPHGGDVEVCPLRRELVRSITPIQRKIMKLVAEGFSSKGIAYQLGLTPRAVENHRLRLSKKLGVGSSAALVRYAVRAGLISP